MTVESIITNILVTVATPSPIANGRQLAGEYEAVYEAERHNYVNIMQWGSEVTH